MFTGLVGVVAPETAAAVAPQVADGYAAAFEEAEREGERVAIDELGDEYSEVFAEPRGNVMSQTTTATPTRGWNIHNELVPIDVDLIERDGGVGPAASSAPVTFPTDGSNILMLTSGDHELRVGLPGNLGEPSLDGATALPTGLRREDSAGSHLEADGVVAIRVGRRLGPRVHNAERHQHP
ncbi:hypothetical protein [Nocardioides dubius]|uniref:hypothetical protein n=1 Tax=Nocardioides dubius TaxID=317019 RepID=UPI0031D2126B